MSDLPPEPSEGQFNWRAFWTFVHGSASLIAVGGFVLLLLGLITRYVINLYALGYTLLGVGLCGLLFVLIGQLVTGVNQPPVRIGGFLEDYAANIPKRRSTPILKPHIVFLPQRLFVNLVADDRDYTFSETRDGRGDTGLVARFRNEPEASCEIDAVRGRIIYYDSERHELGSVSHAPWLSERYNYTKFRVGAERALLIGLLIDRERVPASQGQPSRYVVIRLRGLNTITDNRDGPNLPTGKPNWVRVSAERMFIKVTLYAATGVICNDFWFEFIPGENPTFRVVQAPF